MDATEREPGGDSGREAVVRTVAHDVRGARQRLVLGLRLLPAIEEDAERGQLIGQLRDDVELLRVLTDELIALARHAAEGGMADRVALKTIPGELLRLCGEEARLTGVRLAVKCSAWSARVPAGRLRGIAALITGSALQRGQVNRLHVWIRPCGGQARLQIRGVAADPGRMHGGSEWVHPGVMPTLARLCETSGLQLRPRSDCGRSFGIDVVPVSSKAPGEGGLST